MSSKVILFILLVAVLAMSDCFPLKSDDICLNTNGDHCEKYTCGQRHCSIDHKTCSLLTKYNASFHKSNQIQSSGLIAIYGRLFLDRYSLGESLKKLEYQAYLNEIRACNWLDTGVCLNENKCDRKHRVTLKAGFDVLIRREYCECQMKAFSFRCGRRLCTDSKATCDALKNKMSNHKHISINKCKQ